MGLPERLRDALSECHRYTHGRNRLYWLRRASMAKLADLGLVETHRPQSMAQSRSTALPYRLTDAGRALLAKTERRA